MEFDIQISDITVKARLKDIKNVHLSVHPPYGEVTLSAPYGTEKEKMRVYALSKLNWIRKQQKKILQQPRENDYLYITKESHYLFGERYLLHVEESDILQKDASVKQNHAVLKLTVPTGSGMEFKEKLIQAFYRKQLREYLVKNIAEWSKKMELEQPEFNIRKMKTKWGSCNTEKRRLLFNSELAKKPKPCVDYVIVHELVHLLVRNHNTDFIILMDKYLPEWRLRKKEMNSLPV